MWYRGVNMRYRNDDDVKFYSENTKQEISNLKHWLKDNPYNSLQILVKDKLKKYKDYGYDVD